MSHRQFFTSYIFNRPASDRWQTTLLGVNTVCSSLRNLRIGPDRPRCRPASLGPVVQVGQVFLPPTNDIARR